MGISVLQPSFSGGELAPTLAARVDIARYSISLKTCKNFTVMQHGGVRNRPGTKFVDETASNAQARLIRFKFSINDACVLVFTDHLMRVVSQGAYVLDGSNNIYSIPTPWSLSDLTELNYTQSADVMTFVHSQYRPRELKRFANNNWTITEPAYLPLISPPASVNVSVPAGGTGTQKLVQYQITTVVDDAVTIQESLPATTPGIVAFNSAGYEVNVSWSAVAGATYYNIYKDDTGSGIFGFAGRATSLNFKDMNIAQTKSDTPPTGSDPFVGAGNYPSAVGYYQQRKVYGGSLNHPQTLYFSRTGQFNDFGYSTPSKDDDAITWTMASTEINRVLNFLPLRQLLTMTNGAEWSIEGGSSGFTSKTINGNPQSYNGSGFVPPLVLNDTALYLQSRGQAVSALNYSLEADGIASQDLTIWASHLFRDDQITGWAYQRLPDSIVWCVRRDGVLLGLTYLRAQDIVAWHRHETDGFVESVTCVPEGSDDIVYLVVRRTIKNVTKRYIERLESRNIPLLSGSTKRDVSQAYFVDCGLSYQGWNKTNAVVTLLNGDEWKYPEILTLRALSVLFTAGDVGKEIHLRDAATQNVVRVEVTGFVSAYELNVVPQSIVPVGLQGVPTKLWARALRTFGGLSHLEGKGVAILADGNVVSQNGEDDEPVNLVVTGGSVTLDNFSAVVHIGLPYTSDIETLRINVNGQETLNDKHKTVSSVTVVVDESRGILVGKDEDDLFELKQRDTEDYNSPIDMLSGVGQVKINNNWDTQGQVFIRQIDPLPLTILGIIPELTIAGKA